jgi:hypothetical protein
VFRCNCIGGIDVEHPHQQAPEEPIAADSPSRSRRHGIAPRGRTTPDQSEASEEDNGDDVDYRSFINDEMFRSQVKLIF